MYRDTTNVGYEMYDFTSNNWSHQRVTKGSRKNLEAILEKHSIDLVHKTLVLESSHMTLKVPGRKACDKR
jgi:hypothetical protein